MPTLKPTKPKMPKLLNSMDEIVEAICKQIDSGIHVEWYKNNRNIILGESFWSEEVKSYNIDRFCNLSISYDSNKKAIVISHPTSITGWAMIGICEELKEIYKSVTIHEFYENPIAHGGPGWNFNIIIKNILDK
jgi:hypothetical protein